MSAVLTDNISFQFGKWKGQSCWIVGCGPSLDDVDLNLIRDKNVFALNASITAFATKAKIPGIWWFYRDRRLGPEVEPYLMAAGWNPWRVITPDKSITYLLDRMRKQPKSLLVRTYDEGSVIHQRSVVEDALQIAHRMGFGRSILLGVDHAIRDGEPYSKKFRWKECYWMDRRKPPEKAVALDSMSRGLEALLPKLIGMEVITTSNLYPRQIMPYRPYVECVTLADPPCNGT